MDELATMIEEEGSGSCPSVSLPHESGGVPLDPDTDLFLANIDDDDFDFLALADFDGRPSQHSSSDTDTSHVGPSLYATGSALFQTADTPLDPSSLLTNGFVWPTLDEPCANCSIRGFSCQRIQEGQNKGYCSSCVALSCECNFGLALDLQLQHGYTFHPHLNSSETPPLLPCMGPMTEIMNVAAPGPNKNSLPAKIGFRFSRESIQILKRWLILHSRHPYPSQRDNAMLQRQTGLTKTQISNWLANARRKGKAQPQKTTLPHAGRTRNGPIDIPRRPGTPAYDNNASEINPLQRWVDSPPENEAASVTAIARAIASSWECPSDPNRPYIFASTDEDSSRSVDNVPSVSSAGTSSGGSFASAYSHGSDGSLGSLSFMNQLRSHRRRRRRPMAKREEKTSLITPLKPYQCTFCTETFRTKHDWQRHEKSLHLSLERWICAPDGPRFINPRTNQVCCVFCGKVDPDDTHMESHNHAACKARPLEDKTFYRKDHLNQHLRLVHNVKFLDWCMKTWKIANSEVRSRCGFCGIVMNSWPIRVEHLGEHFKSGKTIADWKGDWGFEAPLLNTLENAIPPYLIEMEENSTLPYVARCAPTESPRSACELIALELAYFVVNYKEETGSLPSDKEMQLEACRVIFASEVISLQGISTESSWLRDLLMASNEIARQAQFAPLRQGTENRFCVLKINGKDNLFEQCPLELQLKEFVRAKTLLGLTITDDELQEECCHIIGRTEEVSTMPSDFTADWLIRLIMLSSAWLADFRQRANLPGSRNNIGSGSRPTGARMIDMTMHGKSMRATTGVASTGPPATTMQGAQRQQLCDLVLNMTQTVQTVGPTRSPRAFEDMMKKMFFLNDANCYRRLAQELTRFVISTMSPNNPSRHTPTDAEIQYQARWILFDSDDPWNQTAADNDEWLQRFKRQCC